MAVGMYIDDDEIYLHSKLMDSGHTFLAEVGEGYMCHIVNFEFTAGLSHPFWDVTRHSISHTQQNNQQTLHILSLQLLYVLPGQCSWCDSYPIHVPIFSELYSKDAYFNKHSNTINIHKAWRSDLRK